MLKTTDIKSIGQAYLEVLGEIKKINEMDPTDHVKKNDETGKFCVYDSEGKKVKEFDSEEEANEYATKNHDALMKKSDDDKEVTDKNEDAANDKSDDGDGMDKVDPKAAKKKFKDRKDKDIDNDGDVDSSDKFLHKRRKAIGKSMDGDKEQEEGKRGFIAAAKAAKEKGDKKFTFAGKEYDVEEAIEGKNMNKMGHGGKVPAHANRKTAAKEKEARMKAQRKRAGLDDDVNYSSEEIFNMIQEDNAEGFQWKDINITLSYHGVKPALILRILSTLKKVKSGKMKLKFKEEVNEADAHTKGAAPAEPMDSKDSPTAKKMRKDHDGGTPEPRRDEKKQDGSDKVKQSPTAGRVANMGDKNPLKKKKEN